MAPISETEQVEWDGLRRRRTLSSPGSPPTHLIRRKSIHPPLGMSHFPTEEEEHDADEGMHPGFFSHFRRSRRGNSMITDASNPSALPMSPLKTNSGSQASGTADSSSEPSVSSPYVAQTHVYGLPSTLRHVHDQDTSYPGPHRESQGIHWASSATGSAPNIPHPDLHSGGGSASPAPSFPGRPPPPPHSTSLPRSPMEGARRQFSFQNVFGSRSPRLGDSSPSESGPPRPSATRSTLSFHRKSSAGATQDGATEEERLGLVTGDSVGDGDNHSDPPGYNSQRGSVASQGSGSGERPPGYDSGTVVRRDGRGRRRGDSDSSEESDFRGHGGAGKDLEGGGGQQGRAFI